MTTESQPTEASPLIPSVDPVLPNEEEQIALEPLWTKDAIWTVNLAAAFLIFYAFADILKYISTVRLIELGICREIHPGLADEDGNIAEHLCKTPEIQQRLAHLRGYLSALEAIIGLILTLPYGLIIDRIGERSVAAINILGYLISCAWILIVCNFWSIFPIWTAVLAPLFKVIGGGSPILSSVIYSITAKHAPDATRSLCFFLLLACQLLTEIVSIMVAASLLDHGFLFTPLIINFPICIFCVITLLLMPSTKPPEASADSAVATGKMTSSVRNSIRIISQLLRDRNVLVLLLTIPVAKLINPVTELMLQYIPRKFEISLASASRYLSIQAFESLILLIVVLPLLKKVAQSKFHFTPMKVDRYFVQYGLLILSLGCLCMAFSQELVIFILGLLVFTLGCSTRPALQSVLTDLINRDHVAVLYTVIAVGDGIGSAVGALILNRSLATAIEWDDKRYLGLPFVVAATCYMFGFGGSLFAGHRALQLK